MSWEELLFDMVVELFNNEIRQSYYNRKPIKPHSKSVYCNFKKSKVTEIIRREGYLNIVSKYIDHKGFREAVEVYIEDRTPYVDNVTNILCLPINSKTKLITDGDLAIHLELLSRNWNKIYTTNYDNLLEYAIVRYNKDYSIITKRHQLSFSRNNAIIKIHGDLESKNKSNFEFDHEYNHRYIISKEDYETYPQKHEAFTQLMRISLLQGVFCLFGFSGEDPNFIAWIKWVRDILVTAPKNLKTNDVDADNSKKEDDYKIYLITIDAKKPTPDKQLFYDNHKICIIPLLNKVVKELLEVSETDDLKAIFVKFFKFMDKQENQEDNVASESAVENNLTTDIGEEKKGQAYSIQNYPNEIDKDVIQIPPKLPSSHPPILTSTEKSLQYYKP